MADLGWHPDPTERHELRFFDGRMWTDHVVDHGSTSRDTMVPARAPFVAHAEPDLTVRAAAGPRGQRWPWLMGGTVALFVIVGVALPQGGDDGRRETTNGNRPTISLAEFTDIEVGDTYETVAAIVGSAGTLVSESGRGDARAVLYMWEGEGSSAANANAMFRGGALITKTQVGLE